MSKVGKIFLIEIGTKRHNIIFNTFAAGENFLMLSTLLRCSPSIVKPVRYTEILFVRKYWLCYIIVNC